MTKTYASFRVKVNKESEYLPKKGDRGIIKLKIVAFIL